MEKFGSYTIIVYICRHEKSYYYNIVNLWWYNVNRIDLFPPCVASFGSFFLTIIFIIIQNIKFMKYRSINNYVARRLVRHILNKKYCAFVTLFYNSRNDFEHYVLVRLLRMCIDFLSDSSFNDFIRTLCENNEVQFVWLRLQFFNILSGKFHEPED